MSGGLFFEFGGFVVWAKLAPKGAYFWSLSASGGLFFEFVSFVVWAKLDPQDAYFWSLSVSWSGPNYTPRKPIF